MIGLDTNVLVRYFTQDDTDQASAVDRLIAEKAEQGVRLHVDVVVLCELVWVLRGGYRMNRTSIAAIIDDMLSVSLFSFEDRDLLAHALAQYREGDGDFADYVIGARNAKAGCDVTATFDRALHGNETFSLLDPTAS